MNKKLIIIPLLAVIIFGILLYFSEKTVPLGETAWSDSEHEDCNVLIFRVKGYLSTYMPAKPSDEEFDVSSSEEIVYGIMEAQDDSDIKAVLLAIDSGGGDPVAGEEIASALKNFDKLSVAIIRSIGASSAYWAATGADKIFASKISDVGGIGVTMSYLDESIKNIKEGYTYTELSSAKHKNLGDPSRPITSEEKAIILSDLHKVHDVFVQDVATNRKMEVADVRKLANGLSYTGEDALKFGLIDEIGDIYVATKYIEDQIGEKAEVCWY